ncbi:MAG TPA: T9SS type A sorting domain-containing protein, partial [Candidatus Krumholzibacterium sp.]|nr:T9SS type A sorting domain-containing protein [Candidatus Krumholzibacterium sp.]
LIDGKGFIELVPTDSWILPSVLTCEGFDSHYADAEILNRIAVNTNQETVVSTALQSSSTRYDGDSIELLWRLSSIDEGVTFKITRTSSEGEEVELDPVLVESNGLSFRLVDSSIEKDMEYTYRVEYSLGGQAKLLFESEAVQTQAMTFTLHQNTPNPFNPTTTIRYYVPAVCDVRLEIFDVTGRRITVLEDKVAEKGEHQIDWNGLDDCGNKVSSGIYFYRLRAGKELVSRKMVLLR